MGRAQISTLPGARREESRNPDPGGIMPPKPKAFDARRRVRPEAARRSARTRIQKTDRKQMVRQVGRRRGGH
jgi:hypothetical protein